MSIVNQVHQGDKAMIERFVRCYAALCVQDQHFLEQVQELSSVGFLRHHVAAFIRRNVDLQ